MIKHKPGDYSDFIIGEIYPNTLVRVESAVFEKLAANGKKKEKFVKYSCTACNSSKLWDGRIDRLRSGRTCRCPECGRRSKRPEGYTKDTWKWKEKTADEINPNNLTGKHLGEIRGDWFINAVHHTTHTGHGHTYYTVINMKTGETAVKRLDHLPHVIDNSFSNETNTLEITNKVEKIKGRSLGETAIENWLIAHDVPFDIEYEFEDLRGIGGGLLRFDFKIKDKPILIEMQGKQHYEPVEIYGGEEGFKIRQIHDNLKKKYCNFNGYRLIEVPYNYENLDKYLIDIL